MHQRLRNSVANPASGPDCSVPATGWAGTRCALDGRCGAIAAITAPLTEPTSETIAPAFSAGATSRASASLAPTGTQKITRSAPAAASAEEAVILSPSPSAAARSSASREQSAITICFATALRRAARAIDEPMRPTPMIAIRSNSGVGERGPEPVRHGRPPFMNSASAATTPSLASSVPTVMRRQSARP